MNERDNIENKQSSINRGSVTGKNARGEKTDLHIIQEKSQPLKKKGEATQNTR